MIKQYRHKRTNLIVEWHQLIESYIIKQGDKNTYHLPKGVVEQSTEWEEIVPVIDFYGKEIDSKQLHYKILLHENGLTGIHNGLDIQPRGSTILTIFKSYNEAIEYQRVYVSLKKAKALLVTDGGNPSLYLKNILKSL